jgi:ribosomal protein S18 acetylase RimI-like enzyme
MNVYSLDTNRITLDASFGDYFVGESFKPHPVGGYYQCIRASFQSIQALWEGAFHMNGSAGIAPARRKDLPSIKNISDNHRHELGFVLAPAIEASIADHEAWVAIDRKRIVGFIRFHHRQDGVTKIYEICVEPSSRYKGIGRTLLGVVATIARQKGQSKIALKCPVDLPANGFYEHLGFSACGLEDGKQRRLRFWSMPLPPPRLPASNQKALANRIEVTEKSVRHSLCE